MKRYSFYSGAAQLQLSTNYAKLFNNKRFIEILVQLEKNKSLPIPKR